MKRVMAGVVCVGGFMGGALGGGLNPYTQTMSAYVETTAGSSPQYQRYQSGWTSKAAASGVASPCEWQVLRNCSLRNELALVTCNDHAGVELQVWNGVSWSGTSMMTNDCGTYSDRVFDAEYEQATGQLLVVYRKSASTNLYYRSFTNASPTEQTFAAALAAPPIWVKLVARPGSDEMVLLAATATNLYAAVWDGASFGNLTTLTTTLPPLTYPYDSAYLLTSRKALVVWGNSASLTPMYTTWNGTAWAPAGALPAVAGTPTMVTLAGCSKTGSNEALMACIDSTKRISACAFSGTSWGTMSTLENNAASSTERRVDVAYERDGSRALALWHRSGQNALRYRTWSSGAWSGTQVGPDMGAESRIVRLVPGESSPDEVVAAVQTRGSTSLGDYAVYSTGGVDSLGGTAVEGLVGQQVPGVALPAPPAVTPGTVDKTYGNGTTTTLAPGAYRDLTSGNSFNLNLSGGTYVFRNASSGNGTTFTCNTAAGDIHIIFTGTVGAWNGLSLNNTGTGQVVFELITGNFTANNNASVINASIVAYAGSISFGNNASIDGRLYAAGNISVGSGVISESVSPFPPNDGSLKVMRWAGGSINPPMTATTKVSGWASRQAWALSAPPFGAPLLYVGRWWEIGQDE
jgi:hypothetical protein